MIILLRAGHSCQKKVNEDRNDSLLLHEWQKRCWMFICLCALIMAHWFWWIPDALRTASPCRSGQRKKTYKPVGCFLLLFLPIGVNARHHFLIINCPRVGACVRDWLHDNYSKNISSSKRTTSYSSYQSPTLGKLEHQVFFPTLFVNRVCEPDNKFCPTVPSCLRLTVA